MYINLPPQMEAFVHAKVSAGIYPDADHFMQAAVHQLMAQEDNKFARLKAAVQIGIDQIERGEYVRFTPELMGEIDKRAEEAYARGETRNYDSDVIS